MGDEIARLVVLPGDEFDDGEGGSFKPVPEHGEARPGSIVLDRVIAPFAASDAAAVELKKLVQFLASELHEAAATPELLEPDQPRHEPRLLAHSSLIRHSFPHFGEQVQGSALTRSGHHHGDSRCEGRQVCQGLAPSLLYGPSS